VHDVFPVNIQPLVVIYSPAAGYYLFSARCTMGYTLLDSDEGHTMVEAGSGGLALQTSQSDIKAYINFDKGLCSL
jgi:hypothetical protein